MDEPQENQQSTEQKDPLQLQKDSIEIEISEDKLKAFIKIPKLEGEEECLLTVDILKQKLGEAGVAYNINTNLLEKILSENIFDRKIQIATGQEVIEPLDGKIEYLVNIGEAGKPKTDEKGNVDFRNINLFLNVKKGTEIAKVIPPSPGKNGKTVTNEDIIAREGKPGKLPVGKNTEPSPEKPDTLIAKIDGAVRLRDKIFVDVHATSEIKSDIDYSTGNIDYIGSLVIKGDIKSGFSVKVEGNLEVHGVIEECSINAGGDIIIKQGCKGKGGKVISAKGSIFLKYAENKMLIAGKDIIVSDYLMNCHSYAENIIELTGRTGLITGGEASAVKEIHVVNVGNYQGIKTRLSVGINHEQYQKLQQLEKERNNHQENLEKIVKALKVLNRIILLKGKLSPDKKEIFHKLEAAEEKILTMKSFTENQIEILLDKLAQKEGAFILIKGIAYPGTQFAYRNLYKSIHSEVKQIKVILEKDELILQPLTKK